MISSSNRSTGPFKPPDCIACSNARMKEASGDRSRREVAWPTDATSGRQHRLDLLDFRLHGAGAGALGLSGKPDHVEKGRIIPLLESRFRVCVEDGIHDLDPTIFGDFMIIHGLTESNTNTFLLVKLLYEEQSVGLIALRCAAPTSSLYSTARTLLVVRNEPVALILDADSTDPEAADRRRQAAEEVIGAAAGAAPFRILVSVPALESLLFHRPDAVARAYPNTPTDCWSWERSVLGMPSQNSIPNSRAIKPPSI